MSLKLSFAFIMIKNAVNQYVKSKYFKSLEMVVLSLGILYAFLAISHYLFLSGPGKPIMILIASLTALILFCCRIFMDRLPYLQKYPNGFVSIVMMMIPAFNSLIHMLLYPGAKHSTNIIIILMAAGLLIMNTRWLVFTILVIVGAWALVFYKLQFPNDDWIHYGHGILLASLVSIVTNINVIRNTTNLIKARTDIEETNEALVSAKAHLEKQTQKLKETIIALEQANKEVKEASKTKQDFLSNMSHELRTPLNAVIGYAQLLSVNEPRADQKEDLEILNFSAENLLSLINQLLDFNKMEAGHFELKQQETILYDLFNTTCRTFEKRASDKNISLEKTIDEQFKKPIMVDPMAIYQIINNLLANAIKFTSKGSVRFLANCSDTFIYICVEDDGIGIAPDQIDLIFDPFRQAESETNRRFEGTGLGLAITKKLCELLGGDVKVESKLGEGSTFSVRFPLSATV